MNLKFNLFVRLRVQTLVACCLCLCCFFKPTYSIANDLLPIKNMVVCHTPSRTYVEFNIINDLQEDYPFFLGGPNQIAKGTTRTFNYPEGTDVFHLAENGERGKEWFTVNPDMQRQTYLLSEFVKQNP